ncbi:MAG: arginine--tRNA ligase [Cyclobacteriaceae bacterium]|nr:arginine--tRNA ligase [Cyclobacteriaceae bacterium]MCB0498386.1 arginine--tRNA ligase [Cyclobacteriaceae bacterium]MCB9237043.1 arginine--tRNA ligase [Flammeovirgaceae bacterium]MCO5271690.1 arginine--tRNA ligase [Cyclobacteriaceae bacterium]MCW5901246.1 arginine--tRNA ligase [Cyclobacteriaceae bacterium]
MDLDQLLKSKIEEAIGALFGPAPPTIQIQPTHAGFEGSHTLVCFPLTKISKKKPEETAQLIGSWMVENSNLVARFNVVKGFLNLVLADGTWVGVFQSICEAGDYGVQPPSGQEIMVEYSSPNTNKPLHLGHLRNNFLGWSVAALYEAMGHKVHRVQIINDRGIHICKSMAAWVAFGNGETPQSSGLKGDKLVGKYYVEFDKAYKKEVNELVAGGMPQAQAEKEAPIMKEAVTLLRKWEQKDEETLSLWKKMNHWVYDGFEATYRQMGVSFDKLYYESETYLLGKSEVLKGLAQGVFFKKEDGSVWVDLAPDGLDEKVLLRSDGTSVYMTQDIGTAILRFRDFPKISRQVYTVGNEQEYHFKVLFLILAKLGYSWAKECYHLSYGMVDLPSGKMKSREGTVVDADDLMAEMIEEAGKQTRELGKIDEMDEESANELYEMIGIGALKFFLLKVDPKKRMMFNPDESIQLQGHTGPFIQYTHARIRSIVRKAATLDIKGESAQVDTLLPHEQNLISMLSAYPDKVAEAAHAYSPALIAGYAYDLAKEYNQFYQAIPIFSEGDRKKLALRVALSGQVGEILGKSMGLLGIKVPERM